MGLLRVTLAIAVVVAHSENLFGFSFTGGLVAVKVFYVISGFYMSMVLDTKYVGPGSYRLFLSNRFLRLYPIYWAILFSVLLTSIASFLLIEEWNRLSNYVEYFDDFSLLTLGYLAISNLLIVGQDIIMFLGIDPGNGALYFTNNFRDSDPQLYKFLLVPQAWSLGVEVTFYLISPFLVRRKNWVVVAIIVASIGLKAFVYFHLGYRHDPWTYRFFPTELGLFLFGTISYRLYKTCKKRGFLTKKKNCTVSIVFLSTLFLYQFLPFKEGYFVHIQDSSFLILAGISLPFIFEFSKVSKLDRRIGELSYPIYLSHLWIISVVLPVLNGYDLTMYLGEITVLLSIVTSYILIKTISDPIEKVRQHRIRRSKYKSS
ncbi:MAG: acyltransferase [Cyanobacteria bacterium J06650_10]